ncbi:helix-turn-helix domain-containing protein [Paracraurococcus ruber]|uniref:HTH cro/C1-type domain-containing protein n=1 Tax=Paracraurococcus ruber TaxID=77675 RepID=A0ABS1CRM0_9PROT|nr:helix-turn-helix transcriptional regulator [Paracraurococcus ruber]MBK1656826.1 hypothetical protein [Paracraurococcus ruber]TDG33942.1 XRE family transcriptional regulator [Paracraurococcus ruber]
MGRIMPLAETPDTVTLSRADFEALLSAREDAADNAAVDAQEAREASEGAAAARADYLPAELVDRLLAGEHPIRVWRTHRGLSLRGLAELGDMPPSYLSNIETGRKPGSLAAMLRLARALRLSVEDLVPASE